MKRYFLVLSSLIALAAACVFATFAVADAGKDAKKAAAPSSDTPNVDWNQWGGSSTRNNTPVGHNIPTEWKIGEIDTQTGKWDPTGSKNIMWVAQLGSRSYGNPVVAGGHVYVGTNNGGGWLKRYPGDKVDLGVLLCFDIKDGKFLWQH